MAEFTGQNLYAQWTTSAATVTLSGDKRSVSWNPSGGLVDATAGSDPFKSYLSTVKDTTVSWGALLQSGFVATEDALRENTFGTLVVGPEGTTATKRKYTLPAFSGGAKMQFPYDNTCEMACDFQGSGTATYGTF